MKFLVTGGAGFIGSAVIRHLINETDHEVCNIDALTYAGNLDSLVSIDKSDRYQFHEINICNIELLGFVFEEFCPDIVIHLAAESHVDRSIDDPSNFIKTNIVGTFNLLQVAKKYWHSLSASKKKKFRFHHVSTDEVFGDFAKTTNTFLETTPYNPSSPYSASKASSDHLVRAWHKTYAFPVLITNCSNNYGPFQFPEKLVPNMILNAICGRPLPIYGDGKQIRDWLFVEDHARALVAVATKAPIGETYNIGGFNEVRNIDVVRRLCSTLEYMKPCKLPNVESYMDLVKFVEDRPGHDGRYAINASKIRSDLGWSPKESFESGLEKTVRWYLENTHWWERVLNEDYRLNRVDGVEEK